MKGKFKNLLQLSKLTKISFGSSVKLQKENTVFCVKPEVQFNHQLIFVFLQ